LPDAIFSNPKLGKFWRVLQWKNLGNIKRQIWFFTAIWYILLPFGTFYGYLVYFSRFGMLYQEKSGNPGLLRRKGRRDLLKYERMSKK
jgi:hypothetical protein